MHGYLQVVGPAGEALGSMHLRASKDLLLMKTTIPHKGYYPSREFLERS